jgi:hypothetical protein
MKVEEFGERSLQLSGWDVHLTTYRLGDVYHCKADNVSPGAALARTSPPTGALVSPPAPLARGAPGFSGCLACLQAGLALCVSRERPGFQAGDAGLPLGFALRRTRFMPPVGIGKTNYGANHKEQKYSLHERVYGRARNKFGEMG